MDYDAGDPKQVRQKKKRWELAQERSQEYFRTVAQSMQGRAVLWQLLEMCGVWQASYRGQTEDAIFREGSRTIGLKILAMFDELGPEGDKFLNTMTLEAKDRQRKDKTNG